MKSSKQAISSREHMLLSIITINYNNRVGLEKTCRSVLSQTSHDYEWIIIDGGSTDGSRDVIIQNEAHLSYWVSEKDGGVYQAMNKGIRQARGRYVLFLNSGDFFSDAFVLQDILPGLDCDIVAGYVVVEGKKVSIKAPVIFSPWNILYTNIPHQAEFIRLELFSEISLYSEDLKILADLEFNLKASLENRSYRTINRQVATVEPNGISNTQLERLQEEIEIIRDRVFPPTILLDYTMWMERKKLESRSSLQWAIRKKWIMDSIDFIFRFSQKILMLIK